MSALIPRVPAILDEMADWIQEAFVGGRSRTTSRNHSRTSTGTARPPKSPGEGEVLSFTTPSTRRKVGSTSTTKPSTPSEAQDQRATDPKLAAIALQHLHESSSESALHNARPDLAKTKTGSEDAKRERHSGTPKGAFDAAAILQRRREEVVFGLKEPISPTIDNHDTAGAKRAEEAEGYQM